MEEKKPVKKQSFLQGAAVLAAATMIVKLIGAIYKIPLKMIIGETGYGYFTTAYDIYSVLLMISTTGLPVAMSRMISEAQTLENHDQIRKIFRVALRVFLVIGVVGSLSMLLLANPLSVMMTTFDTSWAAIAVLAPSVLFICVISAFRGFFQGQSNMAPTSVSQVFEALCKLFIGLAAAWFIMRVTFNPLTGEGNTTLGAGGAILGVTIGCVVSMLYLWSRYRKAVRNMPTGGQVKSGKATMVQLLSIAIPITLGSAGLQIINTVDTMVFMRRLVNAVGMVQAEAESVKGIYNFCQTIFNLPCAFITPITISIIPAITSHLTMQNRRGAQMVESSAMRITGLIAMPCALGLASLAAPIMYLFGDRGDQLALSGQIMFFLGIAVIFNSLVLVTNAMMQAHGDVTTPVIHMIIGGAVKVILNYFLVGIPSLNIVGAAMGTLACYALITALNIWSMVRRRIVEPSIFRGLGKPLLAAVLMGVVAYMADSFLAAHLSPNLACLLSIAFAALVYLVLAVAFQALTYDDCMLLPAGEKIAKILRVRR
ncbi:MAG: oligosaccharide flippase family protein [Candidatus Avoscillospira sp.]